LGLVCGSFSGNYGNGSRDSLGTTSLAESEVVFGAGEPSSDLINAPVTNVRSLGSVFVVSGFLVGQHA
jgi:hypothetical protein